MAKFSSTWRGGLWLATVLLIGFSLAGCQADKGSVANKPFSLNSVLKSDLDMLVEVHQRQTLDYLARLTKKLYLRNPRELHKHPGATIDSRLRELFPVTTAAGERPAVAKPAGSGVNLLRHTFDSTYQSDRVLVMVSGLRDMVMSAYNHQSEFYFLDEPLEPQKFYNSARNIEILLWRLSHEHRPNGEPWLLTNATGSQVNISYERLFGKLIAQLDMMAKMVAHQRNIKIKNLMRSVASAVFLPV